MKILAIESSCDETAVAVIDDGVRIVSNVIATSKDLHHKYGGIMPELAAREQLSSILPVLEEALKPFKKERTVIQTITKNIDAIAVTTGPGLIGSLLVGVETARTIAMLTNLPLIPVNHVIAHMYANFIIDKSVSANTVKQSRLKSLYVARDDNAIKFPAISLVVSGGHTELYLLKSPNKLKWLGGTLDDAAGECFDKTARLLGFGNEGGVAVAKAASWHNPDKNHADIKLPRPMLDKENIYNFSFSGLKAAIVRLTTELRSLSEDNTLSAMHLSHVAHETEEAITDVLVKKTLNAVMAYNAKSILLSGGVAANTKLREKFLAKIKNEPTTISFHVPPIALCTDNAAYIGSSAFFLGNPISWKEISATPDLSVEV